MRLAAAQETKWSVMRPSQLDRLRADMAQLEAELGSLRGAGALEPDAQRRLGEIERALPTLQEEVQRLALAAKPGS